MIETLLNLDAIETSYTVFEKDQVLTPDQLNSIGRYLDDQGRLTRVGLVGVGIACGLWPTQKGNAIHLTHGVGTTTDGDLVLLPGATVYDRFKPYDNSAPRYAPFQQGGQMIAVYELVATDKEDGQAQLLEKFADANGSDLSGMAAVLLVESHLHDPDLCTGEDCDNRGMNAMHTVRLLLVDAAAAARLAGYLDSPDQAVRAPLLPVLAQRPLLNGSIDTEAELAELYRTACSETYKNLLPALEALYKPCQSIVADFMPTDPAPRWKQALAKFNGAGNRGIQYYYDFLKDLAETHAALLEALHGDDSVCCPDVTAFPKHLVLGALQPERRAAVARTRFHPSPAVAATHAQRGHVRFLFRKLDALIACFEQPVKEADIRITPSQGEQRPLEERAIPYYYGAPKGAPAIHLAWSHAMARRRMERYIYSYNAARYEGLGGAIDPHLRQIGGFDFFRIEGHLGWVADKAAETLRALIRKQNLPIDVETVLIGTKPEKVIKFPWIRDLSLLRMQTLLKSEVISKLQDTVDYSDVFADQVADAVKTGAISNTDAPAGVELEGIAKARRDVVKVFAQNATTKLQAARAGTDWQGDLLEVTKAASDLRLQLSPVTKFESITPLDSIVAQPERSLTWINELIKDEEDKTAAKLMLSKYLAEHPGLEHFGGVSRGGTFVLVHDENNVVIADFMLPYAVYVDRAEPAPPPPVKPKPPTLVLPRATLTFPPIKLIALQDKFKVDTRFDTNVDAKLDMKLDTKIDTRLETRLDSKIDKLQLDLKDKILIDIRKTLPVNGLDKASLVADPVLDGYLRATQVWELQVDALNTALTKPDLAEPERVSLKAQLVAAQKQLGDSAVLGVERVASSTQNIAAGSDAAMAVASLSTSLSRVTDATALTNVQKNFDAIATRTTTSPAVSNAVVNLRGNLGKVR